MTWVRLDDGFADHPKVIRVGPVALAVHVWALCYSARFLTDGFVPLEVLAGCPWVSKRSARARALGRLVDAGLWEAVKGGYRIHDFTAYNPDAASVREKRRQAADRQARWRERQKDRRNALNNGVTGKGRSAPPDPTPKVGEGGSPNGATPPLPEDDCSSCGKRRAIADVAAWRCGECSAPEGVEL